VVTKVSLAGIGGYAKNKSSRLDSFLSCCFHEHYERLLCDVL